MGDIIRLNKDIGGQIREHKSRIICKDDGFNIFSPDWIRYNDDYTFEFVEVKEKTEKIGIYTNKWPYTGHGFEYSQFKRYMLFFKIHGIRTILQIWDLSDHHLYEQYIDELEKCTQEEKFIIHSKRDGKCIISFPLEKFLDRGEFD